MTVEEFLAFEHKADRKHEFVEGYAYPWGDQVVGLAGATRRHNRIVQHIAARLEDAAEAAGCDVFGPDMLLRVDDAAYYPDMQLVCDPNDRHEQYTQRPCLIVEVSSDSTLRIDHTEKLAAYRTIPTLRAYLIVGQRERLVTRHWRDDLDRWQLETITSGSVPIPCIEVQLGLDAIYARSLD